MPDVSKIELRLNADAEESLKKNLIPIELAEQIELIDPNSKLALSLESAVRPIIDQLVGAIPDVSISKKELGAFTGQYRDVQLIFSANEKPNAFVFKYTCPPIICVSKGLLIGEQAIKSVDALALIYENQWNFLRVSLEKRRLRTTNLQP
jgi:hypothetical protein